MIPFKVTEKTFHRFAQDRILSSYGLRIERADGPDVGPFLVKRANAVTYVGMTLEQLAELSGFDLAKFTVVRKRQITRFKSLPGHEIPLVGINNSPVVVKQQTPT
jgi:hypothetical protein